MQPSEDKLADYKRLKASPGWKRPRFQHLSGRFPSFFLSLSDECKGGSDDEHSGWEDWKLENDEERLAAG